MAGDALGVGCSQYNSLHNSDCSATDSSGFGKKS